MNDLQGKKVLVVGLARSGQAAVRFLSELGAQVTGSDIKPMGKLGAGMNELAGLQVRLVTGAYPQIKAGDFDLVVMSPGVPGTIPPLAQARELGITLWSELELAGRFIEEPIAAVTGTNGKTTTTALLGYMFKQTGIEAVVAGNIGVAMVGEVERTRKEKTRVAYWIAEVSSFQLEYAYTFKPHIASFLNLTPDHLDRHGSLDAYGHIKMRIFQNQGPDDFAVLNLDDPWIRGHVKKLPASICWFSRKGLPDSELAVGVQNGYIVMRRDLEQTVLCPAGEVRIPGPHNLENALAAVASALLAGIEPEAVASSLRTFSGVPHRLEPIRELDGVLYVNDSKGTNPESVLKALDSFEQPVILIAGGRHKGSDLTALAKKVKAQVKVLILLGEATPLIKAAVLKEGYTQIREAASLDECVRIAAGLAEPGDVVLLSPACASWDMFNNYEERGDLFRRLVQEI